MPGLQVSVRRPHRRGLHCLPARITRNGQPHASAGLPYRLLRMGSVRIACSLVTYPNSGQVGALLYIECQSVRSLRILRWRDSYTPHCSVLSRVSARPVPLGHGSQPFPVENAGPCLCRAGELRAEPGDRCREAGRANRSPEASGWGVMRIGAAMPGWTGRGRQVCPAQAFRAAAPAGDHLRARRRLGLRLAGSRWPSATAQSWG